MRRQDSSKIKRVGISDLFAFNFDPFEKRKNKIVGILPVHNKLRSVSFNYPILFKTSWHLFVKFPKYKENTLTYNEKKEELALIKASDDNK